MANDTDADKYPEYGTGFKQELTVDLNDLENEGNEPWDPNEETGLNDVSRVQIIGQEDPTYQVTWNPWEDRFDVIDNTDGSDAGEGTDAGRIKVRVVGVR